MTSDDEDLKIEDRHRNLSRLQLVCTCDEADL
jgi:hypothetical protein